MFLAFCYLSFGAQYGKTRVVYITYIKVQIQPSVLGTRSSQSQTVELSLKNIQPMSPNSKRQKSFCKTGCGFQSHELLEGLCLQCYMKSDPTGDRLIKNFDATLKMPLSEPIKAKEDTCSLELATSNECFHCSKKIGLLGVKCRCGQYFCIKHRHMEDHGCNFDYKTHMKGILKIENPCSVAKKLDKI